MQPTVMQPTIEPKPGYLTSEFATVLVAQVIAVAVTLGWIVVKDAETLKDNLTALATTAAAFINAGIAMWKYIQSRTEIKVAQAGVAVAVIKASTTPPTQPALEAAVPDALIKVSNL